ncbi:atherin-like [Myotis myotis]|uniref:atherin-like n=1 Tax=Myotis myotis TaxID=51298 RepID=UPI00174A6923|nr:atherin-like [Myotis myotis]
MHLKTGYSGLPPPTAAGSSPSKSKQQQVTGWIGKGPAGVGGTAASRAQCPAAGRTPQPPTPQPPGPHFPAPWEPRSPPTLSPQLPAAALPTSPDPGPPPPRTAPEHGTRPPARPSPREAALPAARRSVRPAAAARRVRYQDSASSAAADRRRRRRQSTAANAAARRGGARTCRGGSQTVQDSESAETWACAAEGHLVRTPMSTRPGDAPSRPRLLRDRPAPPDPKQREALLGVGGCQRSQDRSREIRTSLAGAGSLEPLARGSAGGWRWQAVAGDGGGAGTEDAALTRRAGRLSVAQINSVLVYLR